MQHPLSNLEQERDKADKDKARERERKKRREKEKKDLKSRQLVEATGTSFFLPSFSECIGALRPACFVTLPARIPLYLACILYQSTSSLIYI